MRLTDLVFVVENHCGRAENNLLYTKDDFLSFLDKNHLGEMTENITFLLNDPRSSFNWKVLSISTGSLEFRCCKDKKDLTDFLSGGFNDSIEKMEARGLPYSHRFHWKNSFVSPEALSFLLSFEKDASFLKGFFPGGVSEKPSLEDLIQNGRMAVSNQDISHYPHSDIVNSFVR